MPSSSTAPPCPVTTTSKLCAGSDGDEHPDFPAGDEFVDNLVERDIGESVGVVGEEDVLVGQVLFDGLEALADVRMEPVSQSNVTVQS